MAGLLLIIIWMGCVYLVLKGVSILQIGMASNNTNRAGLIAVGLAALTVSIIAAFFFIRASGDQALLLSKLGTL
jgi:hypothetical protein